eukprot:CAMPEP_0119276778 /NCGR_PEP_ID=MMETSP1329-20130426/15950_1 /TAXON_ID=114041 /ORGANISM="Genus nov. species nov., Strain RCC1024" /LENGTH=68 /DNA_ID=CAMNT_0007277215 /DNA_START=31 /DNA_END=234 /DNA_ORIENTATION=+
MKKINPPKANCRKSKKKPLHVEPDARASSPETAAPSMNYSTPTTSGESALVSALPGDALARVCAFTEI